MIKEFINLDNNIEKEIISQISKIGKWREPRIYEVNLSKNAFDLLVQDLGEDFELDELGLIDIRWGYNHILTKPIDGLSCGEILIEVGALCS